MTRILFPIAECYPTVTQSKRAEGNQPPVTCEPKDRLDKLRGWGSTMRPGIAHLFRLPCPSLFFFILSFSLWRISSTPTQP